MDIHEDAERTGFYEIVGHGDHRDLFDPNGAWLAQLDNVTPVHTNAPLDLDEDEIIQQLYNLNRKGIRKVAFEALLISDGPDHIDGGVENAAVIVEAQTEGDGPWVFTVARWHK